MFEILACDRDVGWFASIRGDHLASESRPSAVLIRKAARRPSAPLNAGVFEILAGDRDGWFSARLLSDR